MNENTIAIRKKLDEIDPLDHKNVPAHEKPKISILNLGGSNNQFKENHRRGRFISGNEKTSPLTVRLPVSIIEAFQKAGRRYYLDPSTIARILIVKALEKGDPITIFEKE